MATDIELAINKMQALHRTLVTSFPQLYAPDLDKYPTALDTANMPCLLTWPAGGSFYQKGHGYKTDVRQMIVLGYTGKLGQNDLPSRAVTAVQLLQAVRTLYITPANAALAQPDANAGFQLTIASSEDNPISDTGIDADMQFSGVSFLGFRITVPVRILWSVV